MAQNNKNEDDEITNNENKKSFMDTVRQINERERLEELEKEAKLAEAKAEKERLEREEYNKHLNQEKIELIKLKSGLISESDIKKEEQSEKVYSVKEKISNFIYHYKFRIVVSAIILGLTGFFVYDMATKVEPDVCVMILASDDNFSALTDKISSVFEQYCGDYNGDGKVSVRVSYLPAVVDEDNYAKVYLSQSDQTKLVAEFQSVTSIIVIADEETAKTVGIDSDVLSDMRFVYKDDSNANINGYMLKGTDFGKDIDYKELSDELFIGFREPHSGAGINEKKFKQNYDNAIDMWTNYLNKNVINPIN